MRLRKKWDLPTEQRAALAILGTLFLLGGGAGCLFDALSDGEGAEELSGYLSGYLELAGGAGAPHDLWASLWGQMKYQLAAVVLGLTALGTVGLPVLFGVRGFLFSFSAACFVRVFGGRGLIPAFALFGLPALLWAPALFLAGTQSLRSSGQLLGRALGEERTGPVFGRPAYWCTAGLCAGLTLAGGLLEYWVVPVLLRAAVQHE